MASAAARAAIAACTGPRGTGVSLGRGAWRVPWDERSDAVVKETRRRGGPLTRWAVASRARRAWDAARALRASGVETAEPLACVEEGDRAWFVARFVAGRPLDVKTPEAEEAAALGAALHAACVVHGDFKPANVLVADAGERRGRLVVIDLDAARVTSALPSRRARARDLGALVAYAERAGVSEKKRARILDAYLSAAPFETDGAAFVRLVLARSRVKLARWAST